MAVRADPVRYAVQAGIDSGPVFRRIERHGGAGDRTVTPAEVARTFKRIANLIGLDPGQVTRVSGHSTRIGAAKSGASAGSFFCAKFLPSGDASSISLLICAAVSNTRLDNQNQNISIITPPSEP